MTTDLFNDFLAGFSAAFRPALIAVGVACTVLVMAMILRTAHDTGSTMHTVQIGINGISDGLTNMGKSFDRMDSTLAQMKASTEAMTKSTAETNEGLKRLAASLDKLDRGVDGIGELLKKNTTSK